MREPRIITECMDAIADGWTFGRKSKNISTNIILLNIVGDGISSATGTNLPPFTTSNKTPSVPTWLVDE